MRLINLRENIKQFSIHIIATEDGKERERENQKNNLKQYWQKKCLRLMKSIKLHYFKFSV